VGYDVDNEGEDPPLLTLATQRYYFAKLDATRIERYHVWRLEQLGFTVALNPQEAT
jgi:hypothetical protein